MKSIYTLIISAFLLTTLHSKELSLVAKSFNFYAGTKASIQWERIFSSERRMKKYNLDTLSIKERKELKDFLISHAADSEQPIVPGL